MLPYEIEREESLKILAKFKEQHPELKDFIELMMLFDSWKKEDERPNGKIQISLGKRKKEKFFMYLSTVLPEPKVCLGHWKEDPQFSITNWENHFMHNGCTINLNLIKNLTVTNHDCSIFIMRNYEFKYCNFGEYSIEVIIYKDGGSKDEKNKK